MRGEFAFKKSLGDVIYRTGLVAAGKALARLRQHKARLPTIPSSLNFLLHHLRGVEREKRRRKGN